MVIVSVAILSLCGEKWTAPLILLQSNNRKHNFLLLYLDCIQQERIQNIGQLFLLNFLLSQDWKLLMCSDRVFSHAGELLPADPAYTSIFGWSLSLLSYTHKPKIWLFFFFIKFCLVNHSINNLLKVPYSIYGSLLLFFFHWKVSMLSGLKKNPIKKYQSSWQLAIVNYLPISKQYQNITGLTEQNDTARIPKPWRTKSYPQLCV